MFPKNIFIRNIQAIELFESFFIAALSSLLIIRFFLFVTRYPQLGGGSLHIAHMLWGGFFMFIAMVLMMTYLSRTMMRIAVILGGIGFGAFIDELGKFITRDNNYFFRPTVAIIYVIFVLIYLLFRMIPRYKAYSENEYLINALDMTKEAVINDLDIEEERIALQYLEKTRRENPIAKSLKQLLYDIDANQPGKPGTITRIRRFAHSVYAKFTPLPMISTLVILFLFIQSIIAFLFASYIVVGKLTISFDKWGILLSSIVSALFVKRGIIYLRRSKLRAYTYFRIAVLISIFLTQFFWFYSAQFNALITLVMNIILLLVIDYVLYAEREKHRIISIKKENAAAI